MKEWLVELVQHFGYLGVFLATLIESTFVPIPAEFTMIPAGILAAKGHFDYWLVLLSSTLGVIAGSAINYWIGLRFGRALIIRFGPYFFIKPAILHKTERFFARYGKLAVFMGRLLPGIKHYIAFVAGIVNMKFQHFIIYSSLGGLIWMWIILQIGYMSVGKGANGETVDSFETILITITLVTAVVWFIKERLMRHE